MAFFFFLWKPFARLISCTSLHFRWYQLISGSLSNNNLKYDFNLGHEKYIALSFSAQMCFPNGSVEHRPLEWSVAAHPRPQKPKLEASGS